MELTRATEPDSPRVYAVHSIFGPTIQGEGPLAGVVCMFIRFAGCNMWDGRPETREASQCPFCDTDFFKGERMDVFEILAKFRSQSFGVPWPKWVWISGGEPMLQLDENLLTQLKSQLGVKIAVETNGTKSISFEIENLIDHLTVSPKLPPEETVVKYADTLKVLFPHPDPRIHPRAYESIEAH